MPFKIDGKAIPSRKTEIALAKWEMYARKLGISPSPKEFRELIQYRGMEHTSSVMLDRVREYICAVHGITEAESGIMTFHEVADILEGDWKAREGLATPACDNKPDTSAARIAGVFRNVPTAGPSMEDAIMAKKKANSSPPSTQALSDFRNWLSARFLEDPEPCEYEIDGKFRRAVITRLEFANGYLLNRGHDAIAVLDACVKLGWIGDLKLDLSPTITSLHSIPSGFARLNLPPGIHRLVGIFPVVLERGRIIPPGKAKAKGAGRKPEGYDKAKAKLVIKDWNSGKYGAKGLAEKHRLSTPIIKRILDAERHRIARLQDEPGKTDS